MDFPARARFSLAATLLVALLCSPTTAGSAVGADLSAARIVRDPTTGVARSIHHVAAGPHAGADVEPTRAVRSFLLAYGSAFGLQPEHELILRGVRRVGPGWAIHLQQEVGGVPVLWHGLALTVDSTGRVRSAAGRIADVSKLDSAVAVTGGAAAATALAGAKDGAAVVGAPELHVVASGGGATVLLWRVATNRGLARSRIHWVDAHSGALVLSEPAVFDAEGRWYDPNPALNPTPATGTLPALDPPGDVLDGPYASVHSCGPIVADECQLERHAGADVAGDFLYDPPVPEGGVFDDGFAEVHTYYHLSTFAEYWEQDLGYLPWSYLQPLRAVVNFASGMDGEGDPEAYSNAFFDPIEDLLGFGQSGSRDYSYDADVVYHEYTHAVIGSSLATIVFDDLGMDITGFALNEGTSDAFATLYTGDPNLGEYVGGPGGIRSMENDDTCPWDFVGEPHEDGEPWGGANWEARTHLEAVLGPGQGASVMAVLLSRALAVISPLGGYPGFSNEVVNQAEMDPLYAPIAADIEAIYAARGFLDCERIVPLDGGGFHLTITYGRAVFGAMLPFVPPPLQYSITVPEAAGLRVVVLMPPGSLPRIWINRDAPVRFAGFGSALSVLDADHTLSLVNVAEIDLDSDPPIEPGTYYIAVGNLGMDTLYAGASAATFPVDLPPPVDAGTSASDGGIADGDLPAWGVAGGRGGCAIGGGRPGQTWPPSGAVPLLLLVLVLGALARGLRGRSRRRA